jgi:hypothetical protein
MGESRGRQDKLPQYLVESCKVGTVNGETTDDSLVDHIFLMAFSGPTGFPPQVCGRPDAQPGRVRLLWTDIAP